MRRALIYSTLLCAVVAMLCATPVLAGQREVLMNVGGKPPVSLGQASMDILHGLPRYGGASNTLGVISTDTSSQAFDDSKKYAIGVILPFAIALFLGIFTWSVCFGFGCARGCCDSCGGRAASRAYSSRDLICIKFGTIILAASVIVLFFIGIVSNAAVSSSLDAAYSNSDALVEYLYQYNTPIKSMAVTAADALQQVQGLNSSVLSVLPSNNSTQSYISCTDLVYAAVLDEATVLTEISPVVGSVAQPAVNFSLLASQLVNMQSLLSGMPDFNYDAINLQKYNKSLDTNLPSPLYPQGVVPATSMQVAQARFRTAGSTATNITSLLNPEMTSTSPTINPFRDGLVSYENSAAASNATQQALLYTRISAGDSTASTQQLIADFNRSVSLLPDATTFNNALGAFNTQFSLLRTTATALQATIYDYQASITALNQSPSFLTLVTKLRTGIPLVSYSSDLISNLRRVPSVFAPVQGALPSFLAQLAAAQGIQTLQTLTVKSASSNQTASNSSSSSNSTAAVTASLGGSLSNVNASLPRASCIKPVFTTLISLNQSILVLPQRVVDLLSRRQQILVQLQRLQRIQYDLTTAYNNIDNLHTALSGFPNITQIYASMQVLNRSMTLFPDTIVGAQEILDIQSGLANLTDSYLSSLQTGYATFIGSVTSASNDVSNMNNSLSIMQQTINSFPAVFTNYSIYATNIAAAAANIKTDLASVVSQSQQAGWVGGSGIQDPLKTSFLNHLSAYTSVFITAPPRAGLISSLNTLSTNIGSTQSSEGSITTSLNNLQTAANNYPDTTQVYTSISLLYTDTTTSPLGPLLTGIPHQALNATITSVPSLKNAAVSVNATSNALVNQTSFFLSVRTDLESSSGFMGPADLQAMKDGLTAMNSLVQSFPDMVTPIGKLAVATNGLSNAQSTVTSYRHQYYVARQNTVVFKNHIDWLRLLGYMLVLFVPICVALCGFIGWFAAKPDASLYMGMCSFSLVAIFFVMTAIQLLPSILIVDQCVDVNTFLTSNFNQYGLSPSAASPWINLTTSTKAGDIFGYFSNCDNPRPELFNSFAQPAQVLANNNINFTDYRVQVINNLANNNNTITLQPQVWAYFDMLDKDVRDVISAALLANSLFDCHGSQAVWAPFESAICSNQGVAGAIALSTCICFLFAICLIPGVCIGIMGYKRYDPQNFGVKHLATKDPYAAAAGDRPAVARAHDGLPVAAAGAVAHTPTKAQPAQVVSHAAVPGGSNVIDPYAQPISPHEIEMTEAHPSVGHRTSLEMALASPPSAASPISPSAPVMDEVQGDDHTRVYSYD